MNTIITVISELSLKAKIISGVVAVALVGGGITAAVIIANNSTQNDKAVLVVEENVDKVTEEDTGNDSEDKTEDKQPEEKQEAPNANNDQTSAPASTPSTPSNPSPPSDPSTPSTPSAPSAPSAPSTPAVPETPQAPPTPRADYNLNDKYIYQYIAVPFYTDDTYTTVAEEKYFFGIERFAGYTPSCGTISSQVFEYAQKMGYVSGQGCGAAPLTWESAVANGTAVDEAVCARFGLSCGRW